MTINPATLQDQEVLMSDGKQVRFGELWRDQPLVLVFLRHYGWLFCREQVAQLRRRENEFRGLGVRVALVGLGSPEATAAFKSDFDVPFTMIADPHKALFKCFELKRATSQSLLSMGMIMKGFSAMFKGHRIGIPSGDVRQLPGVFIIDTDGRLCFSHHARNPADHPTAEDLLEHVKMRLPCSMAGTANPDKWSTEMDFHRLVFHRETIRPKNTRRFGWKYSVGEKWIANGAMPDRGRRQDASCASSRD